MQTYFLQHPRNFHYDNFLLAVFTVNIVISIVATCSNFIIIVTILRTKSLQTPSNILLLGLAVSDFCAGVLAMPSFCTYKFAEYHRDALSIYCTSGILYVVCGTTLAMISFATVTTITADRFLAVYLHLRYTEFITIKRYVITLVFIWFICIFIVFLRMVMLGLVLQIACIVALAILLLFNAFFIVKIYQVIRKHTLQIQAQQQFAPPQNINMPTYKKTINTMYYVVGAFVCCYIPFLVVLLAISIYKDFSLVKRSLFAVSETCVMLNSSLNPLIYCWRIQEIRDASWKLVRGIWCKVKQ